jgi:branched-chain amino acid transport system substrate-binding protein
MPENRLSAILFSRESAMTSLRVTLLVGAMLFGIAGSA